MTTSAVPRVSWRVMLRDLKATVRLVWLASPTHATVVALTSLASAFTPAATLWVNKLILDAVTEAIQGRGPGYGGLVTLLAVQVAIGALNSLLSTLQGASRELLGDSLQARISVEILEKAAGMEVERFENSETYDSLKNAYGEVGWRPIGVATQLLSLAQAVITLASIGALMARVGGLTLVLVLLASIPGVIVSNRFGAESYRMIRRRTHDARVQNYLGSILTSDALVKEVRLFGFERYLLDRWGEYYRAFRRQLAPIIVRRSGWSLLASLTSAGLVAAATLPVLRRVAERSITVGDFSLFALGISQVQGQFSTLFGGVGNVYQSLLYMRNLFEFLELPSRDLDAGEEWQGDITEVEFRNVSFAYPLTDREVLKDVTFKVRRGQALALVGENGAGKTTIVKLLTRLFEPTGGEILLNGLPARRFSPRSVQREMSIIFQDFGQYQVTARENVALGNVGDLADEAAVERAGLRSGAADFVADLPKGYDTLLGRLFTGGRQLSGGQWQRLALARLYFRDASLLVFDEPTASLDAQAEFQAIEALRKQARERITVLISHRFSTVRLADYIVVLEDGRISEAGSHAELLAAEGTYAHLFRIQARGYAEASDGASPREEKASVPYR
jgi:ATP-binding cassette subfamily B protein